MSIQYSGSSLILTATGLGPVEAYVPLPVPNTPYDQIYLSYKIRTSGYSFSEDNGASIPCAWNPTFAFGLSYGTASMGLPVNNTSGSQANPKLIGLFGGKFGNNLTMPNSQVTFFTSQDSNYSGSTVRFRSENSFGNNNGFDVPFAIPTVTESAQGTTPGEKENFSAIINTGSVSHVANVFSIKKSFGSEGIFYSLGVNSSSLEDIRDAKSVDSTKWLVKNSSVTAAADLKDTILSGSLPFLNSPTHLIIRYPEPRVGRQFIIDEFVVEWVDSSRIVQD